MNTKNLTIQSLKSLKEDTAGIVYAILQLKRGDEYHYKRFESYNRTVRGYGRINIEDYDFKGAFQLETGETETAHLLEEIFRFWNMPARISDRTSSKKAVFKIFCKRANCDAQMIPGA